jgi:hypothetical protein
MSTYRDSKGYNKTSVQENVVVILRLINIIEIPHESKIAGEYCARNFPSRSRPAPRYATKKPTTRQTHKRISWSYFFAKSDPPQCKTKKSLGDKCTKAWWSRLIHWFIHRDRHDKTTHFITHIYTAYQRQTCSNDQTSLNSPKPARFKNRN